MEYTSVLNVDCKNSKNRVVFTAPFLRPSKRLTTCESLPPCTSVIHFHGIHVDFIQILELFPTWNLTEGTLTEVDCDIISIPSDRCSTHSVFFLCCKVHSTLLFANCRFCTVFIFCLFVNVSPTGVTLTRVCDVTQDIFENN